MNINYKSRNLEITEAMKEYCEKRLNKFDKLIGPETAVVTMSSIRDRQRLEVTIPYHGMVMIFILASIKSVKRLKPRSISTVSA